MTHKEKIEMAEIAAGVADDFSAQAAKLSAAGSGPEAIEMYGKALGARAVTRELLKRFG